MTEPELRGVFSPPILPITSPTPRPIAAPQSVPLAALSSPIAEKGESISIPKTGPLTAT